MIPLCTPHKHVFGVDIKLRSILDRKRILLILQSIQTGFVAHPATFSMGTVGPFTGGEAVVA
jgi:hypothetical protein